MRLIVTGATGFIGAPLVRHLIGAGHSCIIITRDKSHASQCGFKECCSWNEPMPQADAVIHLAGESIVGLWTKRKRTAILASRIETTRQLVAAMKRTPPRVFLSASAVGYYGNRPKEILAENSLPDPRHGFRSSVCQAWEAEANRASEFGVRVVNLRMGNVLHSSGGYLSKIFPLYKHGLCFIPGDPSSMISWVSLVDTIRMITFALEHEEVGGPINVTAPTPVSQQEFATLLAKRVGRKVRYAIPSWILRIGLGEFSTALLDNQRILPTKALQHSFTFLHPELEEYFNTL